MLNLFQQIKFYFTYHRKDKYGIIVLLVLCAVLLSAPEIYYHLVAKQKIIDHINETNRGFAELVKQFDTASETIYVKEELPANQPEEPIAKLIDINTTTAFELTQLKGIGEVFSKRIIKYRNSKSGFDSMEDLKKVYGISDSLYQTLLPHLTFTPKKPAKKQKKFAKKDKERNFKSSKQNYEPQKEEVAKAIIDINTATATELKQLKGIGKVLSKRIVKYRDAIGGFQSVEQLNEVYGIEDSLYFTLLDNIEMSKVNKPEKVYEKKYEEETVTSAATTESHYKKLNKENISEKFVSSKKEKATNPLIVIDINKATAKEFQQLNGIGNFRAKEIVAHREKLGGFYNAEQLKEVYSFDDSLYNVLKPQLKISSTELKKIDINTIEFKALLKHPYFDYNLTKHLINFRDQRNGLKSLEDLKESYLIDDELYEKLTMYLTVE